MYHVAGDRVAQGDVACGVHGDAAHEPVMAVAWVESPLLEEDPPATGVAQLEPADGGAHIAGPAANGEGAHEGLMAAEIAIGKTVHRPLAQRVEPPGRAQLPHAVEVEEATDRVRKRRDRQGRRYVESTKR